MAMRRSGRTTISAPFYGSQDLNDFVSGTQSSDNKRHNLVLLSLPVDHTWIDANLHDEHYLRIGLLLLFNLIQIRSMTSYHRGISLTRCDCSMFATDHGTGLNPCL